MHRNCRFLKRTLLNAFFISIEFCQSFSPLSIKFDKNERWLTCVFLQTQTTWNCRPTIGKRFIPTEVFRSVKSKGFTTKDTIDVLGEDCMQRWPPTVSTSTCLVSRFEFCFSQLFACVGGSCNFIDWSMENQNSSSTCVSCLILSD